MLGRKSTTADLTPEASVHRHQRLAEDHLRRAGVGGRLEAETRHASMATAHAVLALLGHLQLRDGDVAGLDLMGELAAYAGDDDAGDDDA